MQYFSTCPITVCPYQGKQPLFWQCPIGLRGGCCYPQPLLRDRPERPEPWSWEQLRSHCDRKRPDWVRRPAPATPPKWSPEDLERANYIRSWLGKRSQEETEEICRRCKERYEKARLIPQDAEAQRQLWN